MSAEATVSRTAPGSLGELLRRVDLRVLVPALLLVVLGVLAIGADKPALAAVQLRWCCVGLVAMFGILLVPYRRLLDLAYPVYGLSILLLLLVLVPGIGTERNGGMRWLIFGGVSFQPSELAKVAHVLALARYIRFRRDQNTVKGLLVPFLMTLVPMALILKEPDLGTALMMVPVLFALLWIAGAKTKHLGLVVLFGVASLPLLYTVCAPHQKARIRTYIAPVAALITTDTDDNAAADRKRDVDSFHLNESLSAVAGGGLTGQGWGNGRQNTIDGVPFSWTDFIFTIHAEEWGFLGIALLFGLEVALLLGLATVARELREPAGKLLAVGGMVLLGTQAVVNLAMTVGLAPITGLPLPFLSYGGTSMLTSWMILALALNARARQPLVFSTGNFG